MENMNSEVGLNVDNNLMNTSLKSANVRSDSNTIESFQDGGGPNLNLDRTRNDYNRANMDVGLDLSRANSNLNNFAQGSGDQILNPENFSKMADSALSQMSNFNNTFARANFQVNDQQHGGIGGTGNSDFPQQNSQYNQFGAHNMRPGFPQNPNPSRGSESGGRPGGGLGVAGMMTGNYSSNQQRFLSGPSIQQQGGPTPTLNQLLQNPNAAQRYQAGFGDFPLGQQKGAVDMGRSQTFNSPQQDWGGQQSSRANMTAYQYQSLQQGNQPFRAQGQMYDQNRRGAGLNMPPGYSQPYSSQGQISPGQQRFPSSQPHQQPRSAQMGMPSVGINQQVPPQYSHSNSHMNYNSQASQYMQQAPANYMQGTSHFSNNQQQQQQQQSSRHHQQTPPSPHPPSSSQSQGQSSPNQPPLGLPAPSQMNATSRPSSSSAGDTPPEMTNSQTSFSQHRMTSPPQSQPPQISQQPMPPTSQGSQLSGQPMTPSQVAPPMSQQKHTGNMQDTCSPNSEDTGAPSDASNTRTTPTSTPGPQHPGLSSTLRPSPSPAGSTGSRSNTPASIPGNQVGSPMPPRPPSTHMEGQVRIQSPMPTQGYMVPAQQQMMPPNHIGGSSNKLYPNVMSGGPQMPSYSSQYPSQPAGNFNRGMAGYSGHNTYGSGSQIGGPMYNHMGLPRSMPSASSYHNQYSQGGATMTNQYPGYNSSQGALPPGQSMPHAVPNQTLNQHPTAPQQLSPLGNAAAKASGEQTQCPKGAQAAAQAAMIAAANQSVRTASGQAAPSDTPKVYGQYGTSPPHTPHHPPHPPHMNQMHYNSINQMPPTSTVTTMPGVAASHRSAGLDSTAGGSGAPPSSAYSSARHGGQIMSSGNSVLPSNGGPTLSQEMTNTHAMSGGHVSLSHMTTSNMSSSNVNNMPPNMSVSNVPAHNMSSSNIAQPTGSMPNNLSPTIVTSMPATSMNPPTSLGPTTICAPPASMGPPAGPPPGGVICTSSQSCNSVTQLCSSTGSSMSQLPSSSSMSQPMNSSSMSQHPTSPAMSQLSSNSATSQPPSTTSMSQAPSHSPMSQLLSISSMSQAPNSSPLSQIPSSSAVSQPPSGSSISPGPSSSQPASGSPMSQACSSSSTQPQLSSVSPACSSPSIQSQSSSVSPPCSVPGSSQSCAASGNQQPTEDSSTSHPDSYGSTDDSNSCDVKPVVTSSTPGDTSTTVTPSITMPIISTVESKPYVTTMSEKVYSTAVSNTTNALPQTSICQDIKPSLPIVSNHEAAPPPAPPAPTIEEPPLPERPKVKQDCASLPPTPVNVAPSPSVGSLHDEFENISSPSWPGTPKPGPNDAHGRLCEMGEEPERRLFLDRLFAFMEEKGNPITVVPAISKTPVDLFRLYLLVRERGGLLEVTKNKKWREVSGALSIGASSSAGFTLRRNYCKYLFPFECRFDRGDIDPAPIIAQLESSSKKDSKKNQQSASQDSFRGHGTQSFGPFPPGMQRPPSMPNSEMHQGPMMPPNVSMMPSNAPMHYDPNMMPNRPMMPNSSMPNSMMPMQMPNNNTMGMPNSGMPNRQMNATTAESITVQDPFGDNVPPTQYANHRQGVSTQLPPYTAGQAPPGNMNSSSMGYGSRGGNVPPYGPNVNQPQSYPGGMSGMNRMPAQGEQFSDPYRQSTVSQEGYPNRATIQDARYGNQYNSKVTPGMNNQYGQYNDSRFPEQQQPEGMLASQAVRPQSQTSMPPHPQGSMEQMYPGRYGNQHGTPRPLTPQDQYGMHQQPSQTGGQQMPSVQAPPGNYMGPRPFPQGASQGPEPLSSYAGPQQQTPQQPPQSASTPQQQQQQQQQPQQPPPPQSSGGLYPPGQRGVTGQPQQPQQQRDMYSSPQPQPPQSTTPQAPPQSQQQPQTPHKTFPEFAGRDGFSVPPTYSQHQAYYGERSTGGQYPAYGCPVTPTGGTTDRMHSDMRGGSRRFPPCAPSYPNTSAAEPRSMPPMTYASDDFADMRTQGLEKWGSPMHPRYSQGGSTPYGSGAGGVQVPPSSGGAIPGHYGMYSRMSMGQRMSPQRHDKHHPYHPPMGPHGSSRKLGSLGGSNAFQSKKEIVFPSDSLEATQPYLVKRKRAKQKDIGQVDPWRLMMALKSGQLAESCWALDVLSILLFDDNTISFFGLKTLPGLIEILLQHFRRCLIEVFGEEFQQLELSSSPKAKPVAKPESKVNTDEKKGSSDDDQSSTEVKQEDDCATFPATFEDGEEFKLPDRSRLEEAKNYTLKTRDGKRVRIESSSKDHDCMFEPKEWDVFRGFESASEEWKMGRGDTTMHFLTHFESDTSLDLYRRLFYKPKWPFIPSSSPNSHCDEQPDNRSSTDKERENDLGESNIDSPRENHSTSGSPDDQQNLQVKVKVEEPSVCSENACSVEHRAAKSPCENTCNKENRDPSRTLDTDSSRTNIMNVKIKEEPMDTDAEKNVSAERDCNEASSPDNNIKKEGCDSILEATLKMTKLKESELSDKRLIENYKRKWQDENEESEAYKQDQPPLYLITDAHHGVSRRCICISNIFRSLSFIPGNDAEMSKHRGLCLVLGKLLLFHHTHPLRKSPSSGSEREAESDVDEALCEFSAEWWWETLDALRENTLVTLANICGQMNLGDFPEIVAMPILDGLLHWSVCPSSCAQDPMPTMSPSSVLSPKRLALEALSKLCVTVINVDLLLSTPPFSRIVAFLSNLVKLLASHSEQVLQEFSINLLSNMVQASSSAARAVALQPLSVSLLLGFIENSDQQARQVASSHGLSMLRDNPGMMGTSLGMLQRAAQILLHMSKIPNNRSLFTTQQQRLLALVMSQCLEQLDQKVVTILSDVVFHCSL